MRNEQKTKKQHAVPQNIMEVEFKLIGDMTVRQFLYVAVGGLLCYLIYSGGLPFLIRWFLILLLAFLALGMAFLPMEERGLDEWIRNFFAACYLPTQRVWKKSGVGVKRKRKAEPVEKMEAKPPVEEKPKEVKEEEVKKITEELRKVAKEMGKEELGEKDLAEEAGKISQNLERILAEILRPEEEAPRRPRREEDRRLKGKVLELSEELAKLRKLEGMEGVPSDVKRTIAFYQEEKAGLEGRIKSLEGKLARKKLPEEEEIFPGKEEYRKQIEALKEENKALVDKVSQTTEEFEKLKTEIKEFSEEKGGYARDLQEKEEELKRLEEERNRAVSNLMRLSSRMEKVKERGVLPSEEELREAEREVKERVVPEEPPRPREEKVEKAKPLFSREELAAITSNVPNTISGIVKDREGKILSGIMVVIEDEDGDPVRAIKTNKLGQFLFSIPLPNGKYTARVESRERKFSPVKLICDGSILEPIVFREGS